MNSNALEQHISRMKDYIDLDQPRLAFAEYRALVDENVSGEYAKPIVMKGSKGDYLLENTYLIEKMMRNTQSTIQLYIDDIDRSAYGSDIVRDMVENWLSIDEKRHIKILVRRGVKFFSSDFYHTNRQYIKSGQIEFRMLPDGAECQTYAGIYDKQTLKIKHVNLGDVDGCEPSGDEGGVQEDAEEIMIGDFSCQDQAERLSELYDQVFDSSIPATGRIRLILSLMGRSIVSFFKRFSTFGTGEPNAIQTMNALSQTIIASVQETLKGPKIQLPKKSISRFS